MLRNSLSFQIISKYIACRMEHALEVNSVSKSYNSTKVVDDVSFSIQKGEVFGLLGPNGAGKSTLINTMAGLVKPDEGTVKIFDRAVGQETKSLLGVMHQEFIAEVFFKVGPGLKIHSGYYGVKDDPKWRNTLIDRLELREHLNKKFIMLSGGMKRRYMLAKALIHKPPFLILDEPTAGVDIDLRIRLWEFIKQINQAGVTVLLTTHYLEEAEQMCDRIAILDKGKVIALNKTESLLQELEVKRIVFEMEPFSKELTPELKDLGASHNKEESTIAIPLSYCCSAQKAVDAVSSLGVTIKDITSFQPDLEELFLNLVNKNAAS